MKTKLIEQLISKALIHSQNLCIKDHTSCFSSPTVLTDCPTFDEQTAEYIQDRIRLYVDSWIFPCLSECLTEISRSSSKKTCTE